MNNRWCDHRVVPSHVSSQNFLAPGLVLSLNIEVFAWNMISLAEKVQQERRVGGISKLAILSMENSCCFIARTWRRCEASQVESGWALPLLQFKYLFSARNDWQLWWVGANSPQWAILLPSTVYIEQASKVAMDFWLTENVELWWSIELA